MAFEHTLVIEYNGPVPMIISDSDTSIKGSVMKMTDPMTVAASDGASDIVGGILYGDKITSNGQTRAGVYRDGVFKGKASGTISVGDPVATSATPNHLNTARTLTQNQLSGTRIFGVSWESCTTGETFLYELRPQSMPSL